jgi:KDO2-lipid IV(A) lauroyltransferase
MKTDFISDYAGYITFRLVSCVVRFFPPEVTLFFGRCLGACMYLADYKHRRQAYVNVRTAFAASRTPQEARRLVRDFYFHFGQSLIEIFLIPSIDQRYIDTYITIEGRSHINAAFKKGKGVLLVGVHEGSWEISNVICANLGFAFHLFVRDQRHPRMDALLNEYRTKKGCRIIRRQNDIRAMIQILKDNEAIGMTADQGGRLGVLVDFFGKRSSMPSGAIRLAAKYGAVVLPAYYARVSGPYHKIIIGEPFDVRSSAETEEAVRENVQRLTKFFEGVIRSHPADYFWTYKIWKYTDEKNILILDDGKAGHLRQSQSVGRIAAGLLRAQGMHPELTTVGIRFRNRVSRLAFVLSSCLSGKHSCRGCLWCLKTALAPEAYRALMSTRPDVIISCGASVAGLNYLLSKDTLARSVVIMRPALLSTRRFDLVIIPRHDRPRRRKNIAVTEGALNLIDDLYLKEQGEQLRASGIRVSSGPGPGPGGASPSIGLLLGGNAKHFVLRRDVMETVLQQIKRAAGLHDGRILATTSRRTPRGIETLVKHELRDDPRCDLLVVANEKNIPSAVGGILAFSSVVVVSPESISMISEAAAAGKYIVVFSSKLDGRHADFLACLEEKKYIYRVAPEDLSSVIDRLLRERPAIARLDDNATVAAALKKIL